MQAQETTQQALQEMIVLAGKVNASLLQIAETDKAETQRLAEAIKMRLEDAALLLRLATGTSEAVGIEVQPLLRAVLAADKAAREVLNTDIDITALSEAQQGEAMTAMELAEVGYSQWRCASALALMRLSDLHARVKAARDVASR